MKHIIAALTAVVLLTTGASCAMTNTAASVNTTTPVNGQKQAMNTNVSQVPPTEKEEESDNTVKTYNNTDRGLSFTHPADWSVTTNNNANVFSVYVASGPTSDSYSCDDDYAGVDIAVGHTYSGDFTQYVQDKLYDEGGSLGALGGRLESITIAGLSGFKAESNGMEGHCSATGYVLMHPTKKEFLQISVFTDLKNEKNVTTIEELIQSISWK